MSININKDLVDFSSLNLHSPSTLNYPTYIRQRDPSKILALANKKRNTLENIKLAHSWSDYQETTSYILRLDIAKYSAVIQAARSTPSGTQLTQYPSSRETIRQRHSRPGVRLPDLIGRCSTKTITDRWREGTSDGPSGKCPRNLPRLMMLEAPHIPRHSRATDRRDGQIGRTRQLRGEQTATFQGNATGPVKAPSK